MAQDIEVGDLCEFRETAGGGHVCCVARGTVLAVGRQQSETSTRIEDVAIVAWHGERDQPADVTVVPLWNSRFRSLSSVDRQNARAHRPMREVGRTTLDVTKIGRAR